MSDPRDREFDERWRAAYRRGGEGDEGAGARALERLRREGRPGLGPLAALFTPRRITVRPALALAAGLVLLAAGMVAGVRFERGAAAPPRPSPSPIAGAGADARRPAGEGTVAVVFALRTPGATRVTVAGDFNGWDADATPLTRAGGDVWMVRVNVPRGVHLYSFVLDGSEWRPDPAAPLAAEPVFGARNSVLVAGGSASL